MRFDAPSPDSKLCEVCRIAVGCNYCFKNPAEFGDKCSSCEYDIGRNICISCKNQVKELSPRGECDTCDYLNTVEDYNGRRNRKECAGCGTSNSPISQMDYLCDRCRIKFKTKAYSL